MSVGVPMVIRSDKYSEDKWNEFEQNLKSDKPEELIKAAEFEGLTLRQALYLAHRCVEIRQDEQPNLARALLDHATFVEWVAPILDESAESSVWKEIVCTDGVAQEVLERVYQRTWRLYDLVMNQRQVFYGMEVIWEILYGLASSAMLPGKIQDRLLGLGNWSVLINLTFSPTMSGQRLLKLIEKFRDTWVSRCTQEIVVRIGEHPNATDRVRRIAKTMLQYYDWQRELEQSKEMTPGRMLELAEECVGIDDCPVRALALAERLIARPELTPEVLDVLVDSPYSYIWYLVVRCELASFETMKKVLERVFENKLYSKIETQFHGILKEILRHPNCTEDVIDALLDFSENKGGQWFACQYAIYCRCTISRQIQRIMETDWNARSWSKLVPEIMMSPVADWDLLKYCYDQRDEKAYDRSAIMEIEHAYDKRNINVAVGWEARRQEVLAYNPDSVETHSNE